MVKLLINYANNNNIILDIIDEVNYIYSLNLASINNNVDISNLLIEYTNMNNIYNLKYSKENLTSEILSLINNWVNI